jgi:PmbA protein
MSAQNALAALLAAAKSAGADAADAVLIEGNSVSVTRRLGRIEHLERTEGQDIGLRVFIGQAAAIVSSTAIDPAGFAQLAERAVAMARVVPEDNFAGLADAWTPAEDPAFLDLADEGEPSIATLIDRAAAAEQAALAVQGITNSDGGDASYSRTIASLATSAGFFGTTTRSSHGISVTAMAGSGTEMQRDYDYSSAAHAEDLEDAATLGRRAAERAIARLNPSRPRTARLPVVFDPRVAGGLLGHFLGAINGASIARGTSFLAQRMGQPVFNTGITIIDDPRRIRGPRSRTFDGEGVPTSAHTLIEDGILTTWLLDSRSARKLNLVSTGHAARGTGGPPSPSATNVYLRAGTLTPAELIADIKEGFYANELMGPGVNLLTGDYSRGAAGFMIRNGALAEPVAEITVASTLPAMFAELTAANDLEFKRGVDAPTLRVEAMTLAGG